MKHGGSLSFLSGGGEMGARLRDFDWSRSELGPPADWPQSLKTAVGLLLNSGYPMYIGWGPNFIQIYNDAYRPILGDTKHPAALGAGTKDTFSEIWDFIGPMFRTVLEKSQASTFTDQHLPLSRYGFVEECYFVFSYSPVLLESGEAGGVFVTVLETTDRVLRERRQLVLKNVAGSRAQAGRECIFRSAVQSIVSCREDVPFAAIVVQDSGGAWSIAAKDGPEEFPEATIVSLLEGFGGDAGKAGTIELPSGVICAPWPEPVKHIAFRRIAPPGSNTSAGVLVFGLSPRLRWDNEYREFLDTCAVNLASVIADAEAFELERKRAEALAEIDRAKTAFFSNVSHEFRTPLTLMLGPLEDVLANPQSLSKEHRDSLESAHRNSMRLLKLVNSLLDFSRIEAGRQKAHYQPTDLAKFTADLVASFRSATEKAGLGLKVIAAPLPGPVHVDCDMWENIVLNLVSNAFKFTLEGEIIVEVGATADGRRAQVRIRDTGVGIPKSELPHIFERFRRVEGVTGRSIEGSGIGLALVQELVKLHGGTISAESKVGSGSVFTITLPLGSDHLAADRINPDDGPAGSGHRLRGFVAEALRWLPAQTNGEMVDSSMYPAVVNGDQRVLVVDDNADMRDYVRNLLKGSGYVVDLASDGIAALKAIECNRPDIILSDVMMPNLDGFGLLRKLRDSDATRELPFIMLSARAGEEAKIEGLDAGADDYIVKPFSGRELSARVGSAIQLAAVRRHAAKSLREEHARFRMLFEQAPGFMATTWGPDHIFEFANAAYSKLVGQRDLLGRSVKDAFPDIAEQGFLEILDRVYRTKERFVGENVRLRLQLSPGAEPQEYFLNFVYEPIVDVNGLVIGIFVEGHDVTAQNLQQRHLQLLVNELNHRVKNTLAIVQGISQQTFKGGVISSAARYAFDGRLAALGAAHDLLTRQNWESTDLAAVAKQVLNVHNGDLPKVSIKGPPVRLPPKTAVTIAMALHELCTNAIKYGALSVEAGRVNMNWSIRNEAEPRIRIIWQEVGGPRATTPVRRGFGTRMIERALALELRGSVRLDFLPEGVICEIDAPVPEGEEVDRPQR